MKHFSKIFSIAAIVIVFLTACNPTEKQLAKEKERTEATVKQSTEPLQKQIEQLKNENKIVALKLELAVAQTKLDYMQQPKELKTLEEQASEISSLTSKIEELKNSISNLESQATSLETSAATTIAADTTKK